MTKYVSVINIRLGSFMAWRLVHVPRSSNEKADVLAVVAVPTNKRDNAPPLILSARVIDHN